jgi:hypothetical protein
MQPARKVMILSKNKLKNNKPPAHPKKPYGIINSCPAVVVGVVAPYPVKIRQKDMHE